MSAVAIEADPFYYLSNFHTALDWITERSADLLNAEEAAFIERFQRLSQPARGLLVRLLMRQGALFRSSKIAYPEIGAVPDAAAELIEQGLLDDQPCLAIEEVFGLLCKDELIDAFKLNAAQGRLRKAELLEALQVQWPQRQTLSTWWPDTDECVYQVRVRALCDRLRLLFFGNLRQDWSAFIVTHLGIAKYEPVELPLSARAFRHRGDVDGYLALHACRERLERGDPPEEVRADVPAVFDNPWLESRRAKLLFLLAQDLERQRNWTVAFDLYSQCRYPGARLRAIRVLELDQQLDAALALADQAQAAPQSDAEAEQVARVLRRLRRKQGQPIEPRPAPTPLQRMDLTLPRPTGLFSVESLVANQLAQLNAPVYYVENTLMNSLFGLLCWDALFAAVPGAFFHPFQVAPRDLYQPEFYGARQWLFEQSLALLAGGDYRAVIRQRFHEKRDTLSAFVAWPLLNEALLELALTCIPAAHLKCWFERLLLDLKAHRSGMPDLIQFWPEELRYQMIEVKAPGDRLQDNQRRWFQHFASHAIPVAVCHVQWAQAHP